jgi:hypothetical protein
MKVIQNTLSCIILLMATILTISACSALEPQSREQTLPLEWPPPPLSEEQVAEVKDCELESLAQERYPEAKKIDDLGSTFSPVSTCDWAVLAFAYAERRGENQLLPEAGINAFRQAITRNYGFALSTPIFYRYFGSTAIVKAPLFSQQEITDVQIQYNWIGLGEEVNYSAEIHQANTSPTAKLTRDSGATSTKINVEKELIQALSPTLDNLLPIKSKFSINPCTDNYPEWFVQLTYQDGTILDLASDSNFIPIGGPWMTEVDQQIYVQFSTEFIEALHKLVTALRLSYGQPAGWTCFGDDVFNLAFP